MATGLTNINIRGRYGTGTPPNNTDPVTGTSFTQGPMALRPSAYGTGNYPFQAIGIITGLTVGTPYWFDLGYWTSTGADAVSLGQIMVTIQEHS